MSELQQIIQEADKDISALLKKLASNPDFAEYTDLVKFREQLAKRAKALKSRQPGDSPTPEGLFVNGDDSPPKRLTLKAAVYYAVDQLAGQEFEPSDVIETLESEGKMPDVKYPGAGVSSILSAMKNDGKIEIVREGSGSTPNVYAVSE